MASRSCPSLYASAGVYPHNTHEIDDAVLAKLDGLLAEPEVIACGEIGLDYYHEGAPHEVQREGLIRQLEIAAGAQAAHPDPLPAKGRRPTRRLGRSFRDSRSPLARTGLGGMMHCFGGGWEQARRSLDLGFLISFAGNLTYPKAQPLRDVAAQLPAGRALVETDAPWLAPAPERGKRNEPAFVVRTAAASSRGARRRSRRKLPRKPRKTSAAVSACPSDVGN